MPRFTPVRLFGAVVLLAGTMAILPAPPVPAQTPGPGADQVQAFDLASFGGVPQVWSGPVAIANLSSVRRSPSGTWYKRISAVRVGATMRVLGFDSTNFKGKCITLAGSAAGGATGGDYPDLKAQNAGLTGTATWNNRIASLRIVTAASGISCADVTGIHPASGEAVVFDLANFGEPVQRWTMPVNVPNLYTVVRPPRSRWDNAISAVKAGANVRILAYESRNYLGRCITFAGSAVGGATQGEYPDLKAQNAGLSGSSTWNNRISSLKVVDGRTGATCATPGGTGPTTSSTRPPSSSSSSSSSSSVPPSSTVAGRQTAAVSMGDSFISGEAGRWQGNADPPGGTDRGAGVYEPARTTTGTPTITTAASCHRSDVAEIRSAELPVDVRVNLACSGATTTDFANEQSKPGEAQVGSRLVTPQLTQLDKVAKDYDVKLIAVSIGGNDLGFSDVIKACATTYILNTRETAEYLGGTCTAEQRATVDAKLGVAMTRVAATIDSIRLIMQHNNYAAGSYRIILQSYPSPIPRGSDFGIPEGVPQVNRVVGFFTGAAAGAWLGPWGALAGGVAGQAAASVPPRLTVGRCPFWDVDATWARDSLVPLIAERLRTVAVNKGIDFLDLRDLFSGHEVCSKSATRGSTNAATAEWARFISVYPSPVDTLVGPQGVQEESMHPNAFGQRAIGRCLSLAFGAPAGTVSSCFNRPGQGPESAYTLVQACQNPAAGQACVMSEAGLGGESLSWNPPTEIADLSKWSRVGGGTWNDQISSVNLGSGTRIVAFEGINYQGACITFAAGDAGGVVGGRYADLAAQNAGLTGTATWDNRISSLLVVSGGSGRTCADVTGLTPTADQALLFENPSYAGTWLSLFHRTEIRDLGRWFTTTGSSWNDRVSSVKVGANVRVLGFENVNFGGKCITFAGPGVGGTAGGRYPDLAAQNAELTGTATWDNRISSIMVVDGRTGVSCANRASEAPAANQVFVYENAAYGGESLGFTLGANIPNLTTYFRLAGGNWNDQISSLKVGEGVRLLVFEHTNYGGRCFVAGGRLDSSANQGNFDTLAGVNYNLPSGDWNDRISSLQVVDRSTICPGA